MLLVRWAFTTCAIKIPTRAIRALTKGAFLDIALLTPGEKTFS